MTWLTVPVIDIAPYWTGVEDAKRDLAKEIGEACRDIGFLVIGGHGVSPELIAAVDEVSREFFDLPMAEKMRIVRPAPDVTRGYIPVEGESVARSRGEYAPGDLNESFMIGPVDVGDTTYYHGPGAGKHFALNLWPERPLRLRAVYSAYYRVMSDLARTLMRLFALALDQPEAFFDDKIDRHISAMRLNFYPEQTVSPVPGQLRAGAHTDFGAFTILNGENVPGGLQVRTRKGDWIDVETDPASFVVNIGDLLMRWTNDRWISNLHRVVNPPPTVAARAKRLSIAFFHQPNYDAMIECIAPGGQAKYPPVRSGEYRDLKYRQTAVA